MKARWLAPALGLGGVLVGLAVVFDLSALRLALALGICLLLPGWGWARRFRTGDRGDTLALAAALSICATVVIATTMAVTRHWSSVGGLAALVVVSAAGLLPLPRVHRRLAAAPASAQRSSRQHVRWRDGYRQPSPHASPEQQQAENEWVDWYAGARRRAAEDRARTRALQREADEQWAEWFRHAHPRRAERRSTTTPTP